MTGHSPYRRVLGAERERGSNAQALRPAGRAAIATMLSAGPEQALTSRYRASGVDHGACG
jgi:hypothetical protein